ncbi:MAG: hypothetical protein RRB13_16160 [bacterium]|nr:hypothetical protein [bacterium]
MSSFTKKVEIHLMVDSGAFSFKGKPISEFYFQQYCRFIKRNHNRISEYATLDDLLSPEVTAENYRRMADEFSLRPMHAYHLAPKGHEMEPEHYLRIMLGNCEYFALGGLVGRSKKERREFLEFTLPIIQQNAGRADRLPVHLFGIADVDLLAMVKWKSADSTTWEKLGRSGTFLKPKLNNNQWDFTDPEKIVCFTKTKTARDQDYQALLQYPTDKQEEIKRYLGEHNLSLGSSQPRYVDNSQQIAKRDHLWESVQRGLVETSKDRGVFTDRYLVMAANVVFYRELGKQLGLDYYVSLSGLQDTLIREALVPARPTHVLCSYHYIHDKKGNVKAEDAILDRFFEIMKQAHAVN